MMKNLSGKMKKDTGLENIHSSGMMEIQDSIKITGIIATITTLVLSSELLKVINVNYEDHGLSPEMSEITLEYYVE